MLPSLLQYQLLALGVWMVPVQFWVLYAVAALATQQPVALFASWPVFFSLFASAVLLAVVQLALALVRHRSTTARRVVFSPAVSLARALLLHLPCHACHLVAGAVAAALLANLLLLLNADANSDHGYADADVAVGAVACGAFSVLYFSTQRNLLKLPSLQQRRFVRLRSATAVALPRSFAAAAALALAWPAVAHCLRAATATATSNGGSTATATWAEPERLALVFVTALLALTSTDMAAELYSIVLSEHKRLGMCTSAPVSDEEEAALLAASLQLCDGGSIAQAMLSFPLNVVADKQAFALFSKERRVLLRSSPGPGSEAPAPGSSLMVLAKRQEMRAKRMERQTRNKGEGADSGMGGGDRDGDGDDDVDDCGAAQALHEWWAHTCQSLAMRPRAAQALGPWEQLAEMRRRRFRSVLQAVYAADACAPGVAFWAPAQPGNALRAGLDVARARAFADLVEVVGGAAEGRHLTLASERPAWLAALDACVATVDALSVALLAAASDAAPEPTPPTTAAGRSLQGVFVLEPAPGAAGGTGSGSGSGGGDAALAMDARQRRALARRAEAAARRVRRQPWLSAGWWRSAVLAEVRPHDPVAAQWAVEMRAHQEQQRLGSADASAIDDEEAKAKGASKGHAWERQWERRQRAGARRWAEAAVNLVCRTPQQCTTSMLGDAQVVERAVTALAGLVAPGCQDWNGRQDPGAGAQSGGTGDAAAAVTCAMECLLTCLEAVEAYEASPAFSGSGSGFGADYDCDAAGGLWGRRGHGRGRAPLLAHAETQKVHFAVERAVVGLATAAQIGGGESGRVEALRLSDECAATLKRVLRFPGPTTE